VAATGLLVACAKWAASGANLQCSRLTTSVVAFADSVAADSVNTVPGTMIGGVARSGINLLVKEIPRCLRSIYRSSFSLAFPS